MIVLGLSGALQHDPSAALVIDGETIAAAEEERFVRDKHAKKQRPLESAKFCIEYAGIDPKDIDYVAFPFAPISIFSPARWHYAKRYWYAPDRALDALLNGNRKYRAHRKGIIELGESLGIDWQKTEFVPVEHHLSHASSAYHLSGFNQKCAVLGVDGKGEYATTFFGYGEGGDPTKFDLSSLIERVGGDIKVDTEKVNTVGLRRHKDDGQAFFFSSKLIDWLGPRRMDDAADEPYVHYAASMQDLFETRVLELVDTHLSDVLAESGKIVFAGGGALNVKLNQRLLARPDIEELFVQPASGDSGTALGAATYVAHNKGDSIAPMAHVYLGPSYDNDQCEQAIKSAGDEVTAIKMADPVAETADILAAGNPVAWFHGRMEFGPRALGARSILGCPNARGPNSIRP